MTARDDSGSAEVIGLEGETIEVINAGRESLFRVTLFGLSAQQLVPGMALAGGYLVLYAGNASWLAMLIAGVAALCLCVAVSIFARRHVVTGSVMSYVGLSLGRVPQRIVAVAYLVGYAIGVAALVTSVVIFSSSFLDSVGVGFAADGWFQAVSAVVVALVAGALTWRGLDASIFVASILAFAAFPLIVLTTVGTAVHHGIDLTSQLTLDGSTTQSLVDGVIVALAFFVGFEGLTAFAAETRDPRRTIPRMLTLVLGIGLVSYIACIFVTIPVLIELGDQIAAGASPTALLAEASGFGWLQKPIDLLLVGACFASVVGAMNYSSRIVATAATDGYLPKRFKHVHPQFGSPTSGTIALTVVAIVIPVGLQVVASAPPLESSTYLFTLFSLFWVVPYALLGVGAMVEMRRAGQFRPLQAVAIVGGVCVFAYLLVYSFTHSAGGTLGALPYVMLGLMIVGFVGFTITDARRVKAGAEVVGGFSDV